MLLQVKVRLLNVRRFVPASLPEPTSILHTIKEGEIFEGSVAESFEMPNTLMGLWYKDRQGKFYWGGGLTILQAGTATLPEALPDELAEAAPDEEALGLKGWGFIKMKIEELWRSAGNKGEGIKIAVLDTGIAQHSDFDATRLHQFNILDGSQNAVDEVGHGTHVAGIIAAQGQGVYGVAPNAELFIIKIENGLEPCEIKNLVNGIQKAIDLGVDVISISAELNKNNADFPILEQKVNQAFLAGITIVASAGNNFNDFPVEKYPAAFEQVLSTGSIKEDGTRSDSSSLSNNLDLVAPGENIHSTWKNNSYKTISGTSMATPLVSGVIAVLIAFGKRKLNRKLSPVEIHRILKKTADDAGSIDFDIFYGFGILNPLKALNQIA